MVGADGLGSKEGVRVFSLIVLAQFVPSFEVAMADDRPVLPVPVIHHGSRRRPPFRLTARAGTLVRAA